MGLLRLFLAISVAYGHAGDFFGFPLVPGDTAVQIFYAVSGFYMALVLNEKYRPPVATYALFISNRFMRLFPVYAAVLALTLALAWTLRNTPALEPAFVAQWRAFGSLDWPAAAFLVVTQVVMFGQDLYLFLTREGGALAFWPDFHSAPDPLYLWLTAPQAWTLGLEFSFYLIAPLVVRRSAGAIAAVLAASVALRLALQFWLGWSGDPWSYRFFPSELALFLLGAIGYRVYRAAAQTSARRTDAAVFALAIVAVGIALVVNRWNGASRVASVALLMLAIGAIPALFRRSRDWTLDRHLGELSYPVYVCHILVIWSLDAAVTIGSHAARGCAILALTLVLSGLLYWWIDRPVDAWRQRRFDARRAERAGPPLAATGR